jgi:hypothetical protein
VEKLARDCSELSAEHRELESERAALLEVGVNLSIFQSLQSIFNLFCLSLQHISGFEAPEVREKYADVAYATIIIIYLSIYLSIYHPPTYVPSL